MPYTRRRQLGSLLRPHVLLPHILSLLATKAGAAGSCPLPTVAARKEELAALRSIPTGGNPGRETPRKWLPPTSPGGVLGRLSGFCPGPPRLALLSAGRPSVWIILRGGGSPFLPPPTRSPAAQEGGRSAQCLSPPVFQVPPCVRRICSTRECLYMLSSYDIEEGAAYRDLPASKAGAPPGDVDALAARACEEFLGQLHKCPTLEGRTAIMKEAVGSMPLLTFQKDFFWEALDMIQRAAGLRQAPPSS